MNPLSKQDILIEGLSKAIRTQFESGAYGAIVSGVPDIPVIDVVTCLRQVGPVGVSLIGCPSADVEKYATWAEESGLGELEFGFTATHAVRVRNDGAPGTMKVAFVWREEERLHSLSRRGYNKVGPHDVVHQICRIARESADNLPEKNMWAALGSNDLASYATLDALLSFYEGVFYGTAQGGIDHEAPRRLLYVLGLMPDAKLLAGRIITEEDIRKRLLENGRLVERMQRADPEDRAKASEMVRATPDDSLTHSYGAFLRIASGELGSLQELPFEDAQTLFGRTRFKEGRRRTRGGGGDPQPRRTFDTLAEAAVELTIGGEADLLEDLLEKASAELEKAEQRSGRLEEADVVVRFAPDMRALALTRMFTGTNKFGGTLEASDAPVQQVLSSLGEYAERADVFGELRLRLLEETLPAGREESNGFIADELLQAYLTQRASLVQHADMFAVAPLALLLGNSGLIDVVQKVIASYQRLLANLEEQFGVLNRSSPDGTALAYNEILALDMIRLQASDDGVVLLSPIHPLVMWKYMELAVLVRDRQQDLIETDRDFLTDQIGDLPEPLLALYAPSNRAGGSDLGYSERVGCLPAYRADVVATADPTELSVRTAATKLAALYPAVKDHLRIMVLNPQSLTEVARSIRALLGEKGFQRVALLVARYNSRGQSQLPSDLDEMAVEERVSVEDISVDSLNELSVYLSRHPVHILLISGERSKNVKIIVREGTRLHPLSFPHKISADRWARRITINPRSIQPDEGGVSHPFGVYQRLINQLSGKNNGELSQTERLSISLDQCISLLPGCLFMVLAGDPGVQRRPDLLRLTQSMDLVGDTVVTSYTGRILKGIGTLLTQMHYRPTAGGVAQLLDRLQEIGGQGIFATISESASHGFSDRALRGQLGLAVALDWYHGQVAAGRFSIVGLDGHLARAWLRERDDEKRNDFLAIREASDGSIHIDVTEVKGYQATTDEEVHDSHPGQQVRSVARLLYDMLNHQGDLLIDRRRELLRVQMFREGFRHLNTLDAEWVEIVNDVLDGKRPVTLNLRVIEVVFNDNLGVEEEVFAPERPGESPIDELLITRTRLGEAVIQAHLTGIAARVEATPTQPEEAVHDDTSVGATELGDGVEAGSAHDEPDEPLEERSNEHPASIDERPASLGFEPSPAEEQQIQRTAGRIYQVLTDINVKLSGTVDPSLADVGPSVIRYKVRLQTGERLSTLQARTRDLMRELAITSEPMIDNLPNTNFIYIDVPRINRQPAPFEPVLTRFLRGPREGLTCPVGVTPDGRVEEMDLTTLPHMLVAGSTGSGKTMFLYSLLVALARAYTPQEMQLVLIDPKQTDFVFFNGLPHLRDGRVITDAREAIAVLMSLLQDELATRTNLLTEARSRDIKSYNAKNPQSAVPPILVVIDEFADLSDVMERNEKEHFEGALRRLAQRARNVGIHLVIATQRPTADIVNGTLKSNLPCRVSFRLASNVDSRVILDQGGAEHLLGNGDMLVSRNGRITRLQGFFLPEDDIVDLIGG